jgi:hypothetical protein
MISDYGFKCSFNPTFPDGEQGWISQGYYGLDQGPIVLMIENALSGLVWRLMRRSPHIVTGLRRAGFEGGWLDGAADVATVSRSNAGKIQRRTTDE